jgi:hypothetical protein
VVVRFFISYGDKKTVKVTITKITTMLTGGKKRYSYVLSIKNINDKSDKHEIKMDDTPMEPMYVQYFLQEALVISWAYDKIESFSINEGRVDYKYVKDKLLYKSRQNYSS